MNAREAVMDRSVGVCEAQINAVCAYRAAHVMTTSTNTQPSRTPQGGSFAQEPRSRPGGSSPHAVRARWRKRRV